jgi:hypothetical protein
MGALKNDSLWNQQQNVILQCIISYTQLHGVWLSTKWIPTNENLANGPSHSLFPSTSTTYPFQPKIPFKLKPFIANPVWYHDYKPSITLHSIPSLQITYFTVPITL